MLIKRTSSRSCFSTLFDNSNLRLSLGQLSQQGEDKVEGKKVMKHLRSCENTLSQVIAQPEVLKFSKAMKNKSDFIFFQQTHSNDVLCLSFSNQSLLFSV